MAVSRIHTLFHYTMFKIVGTVFLILVLILGCDAVSSIANTDSSSSTSGTSSTGGGTSTGDGTTTGDSGTTPGDSGTGGGAGGGGGGVVFSSVVSSNEASYIAFAVDTKYGYLFVSYQDISTLKWYIKRVSYVNGGEWEEIYDTGTDSCNGCALATDINGNLYAAFLLGPYANPSYEVKKYNGSTWQLVGSTIQPGGGKPLIGSDNDGNLYLVSKTGSAWMFDPGKNQWNPIGTFGATSGACALHIFSPTPYVAWNNGSMRGFVSRYGTDWEILGPAGTTQYFDTEEPAGGVMDVSLNIWYGDPCVAYATNWPGNAGVKVKKLVGIAAPYWKDLGTLVTLDPVSSNGVVSMSLTADTIYVAYRDMSVGGKISIKKWNKSLDEPAWDLVGGGPVSAGPAEYISLIMINNIPYVAFKDGSNGGKATVIKVE